MTKKRSLLLVSLFLAVGLVTMASSAFAQAVYTVNSAKNLFGRAEGLAEATGVVTLQTQSTFSQSIGAGQEFVISYGQTFDISGYAQDAFAIVPGSIVLNCYGSEAGCPGIGTPFIVSEKNVLGTGNTVLNSVAIPQTTGVIIPPGTGSLTITVRMNVTALYPHGGIIDAEASAYVPAPISNAISISGGVSNPQQVLFVNAEPALILGWGVYCKDHDEWYENCHMSSTAYVLLCLGVIHKNKYQGSDSRYFTVNVAEGFHRVLTSESYEDVLDPGTTSPGIVTNGALITVVLSGIPSNFGIAPGDPIACGSISVGTDSTYACSGGTLSVSLSGGGPYWNPGPGNSGTETFEYTVTNTDNLSIAPENVNLPFKIYSKGPIASANLPHLPCITLSVYKDPNPPTVAAPLFAMDAEQGSPLNVVCFNNCETNLLYPYVISNWGPFDTDIAISNTTIDPLYQIGASMSPPDLRLEAGSATPQTGVCFIYFYGGNANGLGPTAGGLLNNWTIGPIAAGSAWANSMTGLSAIPGTAGYVWAKCEFSQAYGYAAISYNIGLNNGVLADYLAVTIPDPEWQPRDLNGDGVGENAITPINLSRQLQKYISGLYGGCCGI